MLDVMLNFLFNLSCLLRFVFSNVLPSFLQKLNDLFVPKNKLDVCNFNIGLLKFKVLLESWRYIIKSVLKVVNEKRSELNSRYHLIRLSFYRPIFLFEKFLINFLHIYLNRVVTSSKSSRIILFILQL